MEPVNIGVVGLGTVGGGTVDVLHRNSAEISRRAGREIRVSRAAVRNLDRTRICDTSGIALTNDPFEVANDPDVRVVVELIGGETTAFEIVMEALEQGKHVVTANKALIATRGNEIFRAAHERGLVVAFEAAVAGGISIIKILREGLAGNRVKQLVGIVNGTSNFILTGMREQGSDFEPMLREAQALGYAEADPTFDIDGVDAAHKLTILASIAYGIPLDFSAVYTEGIGTIQGKDVSYAEDLGYRIKHLGIARRRGNRVDLRVHPCLIPETHLLASVDGVMNAILVEGDAVGQTIHYGAGAGANPTA
ncbi:MAG: homoserine dehydrogenase, partial [Arenicellales bacterium]|nr:homoserine dehydrogenase [Arenicellales bacterium]